MVLLQECHRSWCSIGTLLSPFWQGAWRVGRRPAATCSCVSSATGEAQGLLVQWEANCCCLCHCAVDLDGSSASISCVFSMRARVQQHAAVSHLPTSILVSQPACLASIVKWAQGTVEASGLAMCRWHAKILKSRDPLVFSMGWRRFQSMPVFATEDANGRLRYRLGSVNPSLYVARLPSVQLKRLLQAMLASE